MKIVIIEDEPKIAENLKLILTEIDSSISVIKILSSVKSSIEWLRVNQSSCDLLFMDINLTDGPLLRFSIKLNLIPQLFLLQPMINTHWTLLK